MIEISEKSWANYIARLRRINDTATGKALEYLEKNPLSGEESIKAFVDYCYAISTKYGEAAAELACEMYDAMALLSGQALDAAVPAEVATYGEVAKSIRGALKRSTDPSVAAQATGRLVKMAGADTTLKNARRDGAQFAWVPHGDTCAFCIALAANGWQDISKAALKDGHAEHIHANCDCTYAVRFDNRSGVKGYDPQKYEDMYYGAEGDTPNERINSLRRMRYDQSKVLINKQKRRAYAEKQLIGKAKTVDEKERLHREYPNTVRIDALDAPGYKEKFKGLTGIEAVDDAIYENTKEILKHRQGTDFEDLYLIDANTGELIHALTTCDKSHAVDYDEATLLAIDQAQREGRQILAIHNHPGGLPPTLDDGVSAHDHGYAAGIAVGHNLEVYSYTSTKKSYAKEVCQGVHKGLAEYLSLEIVFDDSEWYDVLREYGMEVKRR